MANRELQEDSSVGKTKKRRVGEKEKAARQEGYKKKSNLTPNITD